MKTIELPFEIKVHFTGNGVTIESGLARLVMDQSDLIYNAKVGAIESTILAHAAAGLDIDSKGYREGIEKMIQSL